MDIIIYVCLEKFYLSTEDHELIKTNQYYNGSVVKTVKAVPKEGLLEVKCVDDIKEIIPWGDVQQYIDDGSGKMVPIPENIKAILDEHEEKKKDKNIEIIGLYNKSELPFSRFNGRLFSVIQGAPKEKIPTKKNLEIYQYIINSLGNDKFFLISFFTRSSTAQELGALYVENNMLKISGLYPDISFRKPPDVINVDINNEISNTFSDKINKFYFKTRPSFILSWFNYVLESIQEKNPKKILSFRNNVIENTNQDLLSLLNEI